MLNINQNVPRIIKCSELNSAVLQPPFCKFIRNTRSNKIFPEERWIETAIPQMQNDSSDSVTVSLITDGRAEIISRPEVSPKGRIKFFRFEGNEFEISVQRSWLNSKGNKRDKTRHTGSSTIRNRSKRRSKIFSFNVSFSRKQRSKIRSRAWLDFK